MLVRSAPCFTSGVIIPERISLSSATKNMMPVCSIDLTQQYTWCCPGSICTSGLLFSCSHPSLSQQVFALDCNAFLYWDANKSCLIIIQSAGRHSHRLLIIILRSSSHSCENDITIVDWDDTEICLDTVLIAPYKSLLNKINSIFHIPYI